MRPQPAIIGAGPIGLEVAWALRREGLSPLHFDAGAIGATMGWWAHGTRFFSSPERIAICGVPLLTPTQDKATREEYLTYLRAVATQAIKLQTGARGLRAILEGSMLDLQFDLPTKAADFSEIHITEAVINREGDPVYVAREKKESA